MDPVPQATSKWQIPLQSEDESDDDAKPFEFDLACASTPLKTTNLPASETSTIFISPMKKLSNLHITTSSPVRREGSTLGRANIPTGSKRHIDIHEIKEEDGSFEADIERANLRHEDEEEDEDFESYSEAEQTILSDGSVEYNDDDEVSSADIVQNPIYLNSKKRGIESPSDMILTPKLLMNDVSIPTLPDSSDRMSICNTSSASQFKLSFSNSDSTPCPRQPRKRLKFKETTPSSTPSITQKKKNILNLSHSMKTSASILTQLNNTVRKDIEERSDEVDEDDIDGSNGEEHYEKPKISRDGTDSQRSFTLVSRTSSPLQSSTTANTTMSSGSRSNANNNHSSTPISQSTPVNSRAPTPPFADDADNSASEYGDSINGFKFVKQKQSEPVVNHPYYSYKTPESNLIQNMTYSQKMKMEYFSGKPVEVNVGQTNGSDTKSTGKYQIVGEFPVTSAGLMNEDDEDLHIGDKRINDPYLGSATTMGSKLKNVETNEDTRRHMIRDEYFSSYEQQENIKLPLLQQFRLIDPQMESKSEILDMLSDGHSVYEFYKYICDDLTGNTLLELVKRERIKWHPDKWVGNNIIDKDIIEEVSKVLNLLIERLK